MSRRRRLVSDKPPTPRRPRGPDWATWEPPPMLAGEKTFIENLIAIYGDDFPPDLTDRLRERTMRLLTQVERSERRYNRALEELDLARARIVLLEQALEAAAARRTGRKTGSS